MIQPQSITNQEDLLNAIADLEKKRAIQSDTMRREFWVVYEGLKPVNLIKSAMNDVRESPELTGGIISSALGIASGMITNKLFVGNSHNPLRKLMGTLLMFGVRKLVTENQPVINAIGQGIMKLTKNKSSAQEEKE
ncbi:MAG: hypothetical protein ACKVOK_12000 [Flavobacteriales bacterium]